MRGEKTLRIARWEVARSASEVDRRAVVAVALAVVAMGALGPVLVEEGGRPEDGIYRVGVGGDGPYAPAVDADRALRRVDPDDTRGAEVVLEDERLAVQDTPRGRAALDRFRDAVVAYNDRVMATEPDQVAAFPVAVTLVYRSPGSVGADGAPTDGGENGTDGGGGSGDGTDIDGDDGTSRPDGGGLPRPGDVDDAVRAAGSGLLGGPQRGSPGSLSPPFPLRSLVLAFAFVLPLNVVIQAFGSSVMAERLNRRGEALLVAPVGRWSVVAGKTLPYAVAAMGITVTVALAVGGGPLSVLAMVPVAAAFLGATFLAGMFARSFKELTFLTVVVSVFGTAYTFVPAIFTEVHPIAAISPLSLVVRDLTGAGAGAGTAVFATLPMGLTALAMFALGAGVFREEDMFTQRSVPAKLLDAVAAHLTRRRLPVWGALAIPFVLAAELFAVALLFVLPVGLSLPLLLVVVAAVEEVAKSLPVYAGLRRSRFPGAGGLLPVAALGALAGVGFAAGEKLTLLARLVGLQDLEVGRVAFAETAAGDPALLATLLVAPFALHAATTAVTALGAARSARGYVAGLTAAVVLHVAYNAAVVSSLV